jgi:hypothetical protein
VMDEAERRLLKLLPRAGDSRTNLLPGKQLASPSAMQKGWAKCPAFLIPPA